MFTIKEWNSGKTQDGANSNRKFAGNIIKLHYKFNYFADIKLQMEAEVKTAKIKHMQEIYVEIAPILKFMEPIMSLLSHRLTKTSDFKNCGPWLTQNCNTVY